jgi:hypothetical protein
MPFTLPPTMFAISPIASAISESPISPASS